MSLWVNGDKKHGKRSFYFFSPDPLTFMICAITMIALVMQLLAPAIRWLLSLLR